MFKNRVIAAAIAASVALTGALTPVSAQGQLGGKLCARAFYWANGIVRLRAVHCNSSWPLVWPSCVFDFPARLRANDGRNRTYWAVKSGPCQFYSSM